MALTVTLADLRTQVRQRADMENTTFVTDSEITGYINSAIADLYDVLTSKVEDYYTISASVVTNGTSDSFALPADFYKLVAVDYQLSGLTQPMEKFNFQDRNRFIYNAQVIRYRIIKNNILFKPVPSAQTITVWYVPAFTALVSDSDTFDGINGWETYVVLDAAQQCLAKEESDVSAIVTEKAQVMAKIEMMANNRDQGRPETVADVSGYRQPYHIYFGDE